MFLPKKQKESTPLPLRMGRGRKDGWAERRIFWCASSPSMVFQFYMPHMKAMQQLGVRVAMVSAFTPHEKKNFVGQGIDCHDIGVDRGGRAILGEVRVLVRLLRLLRREKPDGINLLGLKMVLYGGLVGRWLGLPVVGHLAGLGVVFLKWQFFPIRWLLKILLPLCYRGGRRLVVMNHDNFSLLNKKFFVGKKNLRLVMGAGVDVARFTPSQKKTNMTKKITIITMARLLKAKGIVAFCHLAKTWGQYYPAMPANFLIYGAPDYQNPDGLTGSELKKLSSYPVTFMGHQKNNVKALISADVVVLLSSYGEGLPQVLLEAAAMAKPLLAFDSVGSRDICRHGQTGLLLKKSSSPQQWARALARLLVVEKNRLGLSPLGKKLGQGGRRWVVAQSSLAIIRQKLIAVWQEIL